jgi:hypothetical protein
MWIAKIGVNKLTSNRPFRVSLLARSTALCVARRSAVLARREGRRFGCGAAAAVVGGVSAVAAMESAAGAGAATVAASVVVFWFCVMVGVCICLFGWW